MHTVHCSGHLSVCPGVVRPGVSRRGVGVCPGVYPSMQWGRHLPPPPTVDRILDTRSENITFPQLLLQTLIIDW